MWESRQLPSQLLPSPSSSIEDDIDHCSEASSPSTDDVGSIGWLVVGALAVSTIATIGNVFIAKWTVRRRYRYIPRHDHNDDHNDDHRDDDGAFWGVRAQRPPARYA